MEQKIDNKTELKDRLISFYNINRFKIWLTDSKKEKKPLKTEYYFYANTE